MRALYRGWIGVVASALVLGCTSTTQGGSVGADRRQLLLVSSAQVDQMAVQAYQGALGEAKKSNKLNTDAPMVKRVRAVAARLIPQVAVFRPDALKWKWEVNVIESDELNAWCMQGGKIAVYTGIVDKLKLTDDELAAIMGHEMSHALREHSREQISQSVATQLGVNVGAALLGLGAVAGDLMNTGANLILTLPNSRQAEREADRMGVELAARAGYDPRAAVNVWKKMASAGSGAQPPAWLSTHPSHAERTADLARYAAVVMPLYQQAQRKGS